LVVNDPILEKPGIEKDVHDFVNSFYLLDLSSIQAQGTIEHQSQKIIPIIHISKLLIPNILNI